MAKAAKQTTRARTALQSKRLKTNPLLQSAPPPEPAFTHADHVDFARIEREFEWLGRSVVMAHAVLIKSRNATHDCGSSQLLDCYAGELRETADTLRRFADIAERAGEHLALTATVAKPPKARLVR